MEDHLWWYVARATGLVGWAVATLAVLWGLALSTRALGTRPGGAWLRDLHRFLGGLSLLLVVGHLAALVADQYVDFSLTDLLVPGASSWRPAAVAAGVVAFYLLVAVEVTSMARSRFSPSVWRNVHRCSFAVYLLSTVHLLTAGTDAVHPAVRLLAVASVSAVSFFVVYRAVAVGRPISRRAPGPDRPSVGGFNGATRNPAPVMTPPPTVASIDPG